MKFNTLVWAFALAISIFSCKENSEKEVSGNLNIFLTDAPDSRFEGVYIDLRNVLVNFSSDPDSEWQEIEEVEAGLYNLLELSGGVETFIGRQPLSGEKILGVMLVLGDGNYIVKDGEEHELMTPGDLQSGLKVILNATVNPSSGNSLTLDFDAAASIIAYNTTSAGDYYVLQPQIRAYFQEEGAAITGVISPDTISASVDLFSESDTMTTFVDAGGKFYFGGLSAGSYALKVNPYTLFDSVLIEHIEVNSDDIEDLGTVLLTTSIKYGTVMGEVTPVDVVDYVCLRSDGDSVCTNVDSDGIFIFSGVNPGTYNLTVQPEEDSHYLSAELTDVDVVIGDTVELSDVQLEKEVEPSEGGIVGKITPASVSTRISAIIGEDTTQIYSGSDGNFGLYSLPTGMYTLWYTPADTDYEDVYDYSVEVKDGEVTDVGIIHLSKK